MAKFILRGNSYRTKEGKVYKKGQQVESDKALDKKFPNNFVRLDQDGNMAERITANNAFIAVPDPNNEHKYHVIHKVTRKRITDEPLDPEEALSLSGGEFEESPDALTHDPTAEMEKEFDIEVEEEEVEVEVEVELEPEPEPEPEIKPKKRVTRRSSKKKTIK